MTTTPENRIRAHYLAMKKRFDPRRESMGPNIFMPLARHWKRPIEEIKEICNYKQDEYAQQHEQRRKNEARYGHVCCCPDGVPMYPNSGLHGRICPMYADQVL